MIRTLLIDDEKNNRQIIADMLNAHIPHVSVIAEADGVKTGLAAIRRDHPELVMLDIRLEDGDAFDLLKQLGNIDFKIIFITAYEEYALKAIKFSALDYLLKPVVLEELKQAIEKVEKQISRDLNVQLSELSNNLKTTKKKRIVLHTAEKLQLIPINEIVRCQAERNYTMFFLENGKKMIVSNPMKDYEDILSEQGFFRSHKSHLVNLSFVDAFVKADGGYIVLNDGTSLPVSVRKKNQLINLFDNQ